MSMHHKWFRVIHRGRLAFLRERFSGLDVEPRLLPLLCRLHDGEGLRQEDLRAESGLDKTTVAHAVKRLVQLGYISRKRAPADRRSYSLALTEKAKALVPSVIDAMIEWETSLTSDFSVDEVRAVDDYLRRMAANSEARLRPPETTADGRCRSGPR